MRRPGMFIGGTDERAVHHLVAELLDNAMDEAVAGVAIPDWPAPFDPHLPPPPPMVVFGGLCRIWALHTRGGR